MLWRHGALTQMKYVREDHTMNYGVLSLSDFVYDSCRFCVENVPLVGEGFV